MLNITSVSRMWINQPSTLQPFHKLHGTNVIAIFTPDDKSTATVFPTSGYTLSMQVPANTLSHGWVNTE